MTPGKCPYFDHDTQNAAFLALIGTILITSALEAKSMPTPEHQRREHPRVVVRVPVELFVEDSESPIRGATADLSLSGCYIETMFPFAIGTTLELKLQVDGTLLVLAKVFTCDPQVGNGMQFTKMLPEDIEELRAFLEAQKTG